MDVFFWFETFSGKIPPDFVCYMNFKYVGMNRDVEPQEVDDMHLVFLGVMGIDDFYKKYKVGYFV